MNDDDKDTASFTYVAPETVHAIIKKDMREAGIPATSEKRALTPLERLEAARRLQAEYPQERQK